MSSARYFEGICEEWRDISRENVRLDLSYFDGISEDLFRGNMWRVARYFEGICGNRGTSISK